MSLRQTEKQRRLDNAVRDALTGNDGVLYSLVDADSLAPDVEGPLMVDIAAFLTDTNSTSAGADAYKRLYDWSSRVLNVVIPSRTLPTLLEVFLIPCAALVETAGGFDDDKFVSDAIERSDSANDIMGELEGHIRQMERSLSYVGSSAIGADALMAFLTNMIWHVYSERRDDGSVIVSFGATIDPEDPRWDEPNIGKLPLAQLNSVTIPAPTSLVSLIYYTHLPGAAVIGPLASAPRRNQVAEYDLWWYDRLCNVYGYETFFLADASRGEARSLILANQFSGSYLKLFNYILGNSNSEDTNVVIDIATRLILMPGAFGRLSDIVGELVSTSSATLNARDKDFEDRLEDRNSARYWIASIFVTCARGSLYNVNSDASFRTIFNAYPDVSLDTNIIHDTIVLPLLYPSDTPQDATIVVKNLYDGLYRYWGINLAIMNLKGSVVPGSGQEVLARAIDVIGGASADLPQDVLEAVFRFLLSKESPPPNIETFDSWPQQARDAYVAVSNRRYETVTEALMDMFVASARR